MAFDAAYVGPAGLCVRRFDAEPACKPRTVAMPVRSVALFRWLGDAVTGCCNPGERLAFVTETNGYGAGVGRMLGIAIGIVEGTLVDMNAIEPESRLDVASVTWRAVLGRGHKTRIAKLLGANIRRQAWKAAAVSWARNTFGLVLTADEAEALAMSEWYRTTQYLPFEGAEYAR